MADGGLVLWCFVAIAVQFRLLELLYALVASNEVV